MSCSLARRSQGLESRGLTGPWRPTKSSRARGARPCAGTVASTRRRMSWLRAWFARARHDKVDERRFLEQLIAIDPGQPSALTRLAELAQDAGEVREAKRLRQQKAELDLAFDRFNRLYREDKYVEHLDELAKLAEQLGRRFEARSFWELVQLQTPSNTAAAQALARLGSIAQAPARSSGTLADLLAAELGPRVRPASSERPRPQASAAARFRHLMIGQPPPAWRDSCSIMAYHPFINSPRCLAEVSG